MEGCVGSWGTVSKRGDRAGQLASQDADHCHRERASHSPLILVREEHGEQELEIFPLLDRFSR